MIGGWLTLPENITVNNLNNPLYVNIPGVQSSANNSSTPLAGSETFTGTAEQNTHPDVMVSCKADADGTLYFDFSNDGSNWDTFPTNGFTVTSGIHEFHVAVKGPRYFRIRLINGSAPQSYLRLYTYYGVFRQGNLPLNQSVSADADAIITRSILMGSTDGGKYVNVPVSAEGHLEVTVHGPRTAFGQLKVESETPIFQNDFVYGINPIEVIQTTGIIGGGTSSGSIYNGNNLATVSTGTTALSYAVIQSRRRLRYRAGQGICSRFTAVFSSPAANSVLVIGLGTAEAGFYFGYNGTQFGVLHSTGGVREIQTLTITTASTATNNYNVTLDGTTFNVTATNNASTVMTAYEISKASYPGWSVEQRGSTVIFLSNTTGNKSGSFSLAQSGAGVPAAGTFAETLAGVDPTNTWIAQSDFNVDKLDGTGPSGFTINPQLGNVFQMKIQYLGFGGVTMEVEHAPEGNNPDFIPFHNFLFPNTLTIPTLSQPSFPFTMAAYSAGSTTDVTVSNASYAGFIEGEKVLTGPRITFQRETNGYVGSAANTYYPLFTIRNSLVHGHGITERANQSVINLLSISCSHDDATPVSFVLIRNATLGGVPNFTKYSTVSCAYWDTAATTCTITNNEQLVSSIQTGQASGETLSFEDDIILAPGETITLAARAVTGTATYVNGTLNIREDQ